MWWAERGGRLCGRLGLAALVVALASCQVRPLYAPGPDGVAVGQVLPAIEIAPPETRPEQEFRNALLFRFRGGEGGAPPLYRLDYRLTLIERQVAIQQFSGTPAAYQVAGSLTYILRDIAGGGRPVAERASAVASFDRSSQEFANVRARQEAERRVAESLAEIVAARLAARLAAR